MNQKRNRELLGLFAEKKKEEEFYKKTIDIYDLFSIISELFEDLGLISTDDIDKNKISFKMVYPIDLPESIKENVVIFDLYDRSRTVYNDRSQVKAQTILKQTDTLEGREQNLLAYLFTNTVLLHVYSASSEKLYQILRTIEQVFLQYKEWFNMNYRVKVEYEGIKTTAESNNLYHNRIYSKTICLTVRTEAQFEHRYELVKSIEQQNN